MATGNTVIGYSDAGIMKSANAFTVTRETVVSAGAVGASTTASFSISLSKSGYSALGVVGWVISETGSSYMSVTRVYLSSARTTCYVNVRNTNSTAYSGIKIVAYILWVRD